MNTDKTQYSTGFLCQCRFAERYKLHSQYFSLLELPLELPFPIDKRIGR